MRAEPIELGTIVIRDVTFKVLKQAEVFVDGQWVDASCDPPTYRKRTIRIREGLTPSRELDVLIHEMLHGAFWDIDEGAIDQTASDIQAALELLGYGKIPRKRSTNPNPKRKRGTKQKGTNDE